MSGVVGHVTYAAMAYEAAKQADLPAAKVIGGHYGSYLAGSYLGADIMTLPSSLCPSCGGQFGYGGTEGPTRCPNDGTPLTTYYLTAADRRYSALDVHGLLYGRSHLLFGWGDQDQQRRLGVRWQMLGAFFSALLSDAEEFFGSSQRPVAYAYGWLTHVVSDALIKSFHPGISMDLLDGTYTPRNRPIQDLYCFHRVGRDELGMDWPEALEMVASAPVEPIQGHWMRAGPRRGLLGELCPLGWQSDLQDVLTTVMQENRRYQKTLNCRTLEELELVDRTNGPTYADRLAEATGGLSYQEMMDAADRAGYRNALNIICDRTVELFQVLPACPQGVKR